MMMAQAGRGEETDKMYRQLEDDFTMMSKRFSGAEFQVRRRDWAT